MSGIYLTFLDMKKNLRGSFRERLPVIFCRLALLICGYINLFFVFISVHF